MQHYTLTGRQTERINWIDIVRCFAIICVVVNHAIETTYTLTLEGLKTFSMQSRVFAFGGFTFGRLGVPLFLMISGYLLLDRNWDQERCLEFWKTNWLNLFICTEIWWVIYDLFITVYYKTPFHVIEFIQDILFLKKISLLHVWYMPMILGLYILIPIAGMALQNFDTKHLLFPILIFSAYSFGYPILSRMFNAIGHPLSLQFSLGFSGGVYGLFLVFGYLIKKNIFNKIPKLFFAVIFVGAFCATVLYQINEYRMDRQYNVWYDNGLLALCAVALMVLFSKVLPSIEITMKTMGVIRNLSEDSFGIYLVHTMILAVIQPFVHSVIKVRPIYPIQSVCLAITVFFLSWLLVECCRKIPIFGTKIFNIKQ